MKSILPLLSFINLANAWAFPSYCTTSYIETAISALDNPPTSIAFAATDFCPSYLQITDFVFTTLSLTETLSSTDIITKSFTTITTDRSTPTSTVYCPEATPSQICGLSNGNQIDPTALDEDFNEDGTTNSPEECYQFCLSLTECKSYFVSEQPDGSGLWNCLIFRNTLKGNVASASAGDNFFDRGCTQNLPTGCKSPEKTARAVLNKRAPFPAVITAAPIAQPRDILAPRAATIPAYLSAYNVFPSEIILSEACSCIVTSALPDVTITQTDTTIIFNATAIASTTTSETDTVITTVYSTTIYTTVR